MSYYQDRKTANKIIDDMIKEGEARVKIVFKISTLYGYGEKFVDERINLLKELKEETA